MESKERTRVLGKVDGCEPYLEGKTVVAMMTSHRAMMETSESTMTPKIHACITGEQGLLMGQGSRMGASLETR
jgi:hypothetical protein